MARVRTPSGSNVLLESAPAATPTPGGRSPFREALQCLAEAGVRFSLLRDDPAELNGLKDLDLLVHPAERVLAAAALARAGFVPKRDRRLRLKTVYLSFTGGSFHVLDVHDAFVQSGIEYMSARGALGRVDRTGPFPRLLAEDLFLHLFFHNLLGKPAVQAKHAGLLRALHARGLDAGRIDDQARRFGMRKVMAAALADVDAWIEDPAAFAHLRTLARRRLLQRPANRLVAWRFRHGDRLRLRRRPVVLALLGPDGSGKTSFADALQALLHDSPLRAGRVYMGCWGHDLLPMRQARRLIPPQVSHGRVLAARLGLRIQLTAEESARLAARPAPLGLALAAVRSHLKSVLFAAALGTELAYRYVRHIAFSRRPIVLTDRYVYDLEFRQGRTPFAHGRVWRALLYRIFPAPDGILYLTTPYDLVAVRKPQLDREQFATMDRVFRAVLQRHQPLEIVSDAPPDAMARAFLTRHLESLLARCNARA